MAGFCGKDCDSCTRREGQGCPGCGEGPGRPLFGDCGIAACCRGKGHESCKTFHFLGNGCVKVKGRENAPMARRQAAEEQQRRRQRWCAENMVHLGTWLWLR